MTTIKRPNYFDDQNVTYEDLTAEQNAWHETLSDNTLTVISSGVAKDQPVQRVLFDLNSAPTSVGALLSAGFDGSPIYPVDAFGNTVILQPSDATLGNQLEVEISDADLAGSVKAHVYLFGLILGGGFVQEVLEFDNPGSRITRNYFTRLVAFMTQNFRGNTNTIVDGHGCYNSGGRLRIMESLPFTVAEDSVMAGQTYAPNLAYINFKPAAGAKTLDLLLNEIAASDNQSAGDLGIATTATTTRALSAGVVGLMIGEKFLATTNNIQGVSLMLSVPYSPTYGYDWTGDLVVGIRALQTSASNMLNTIPGSLIEFDPQPSALVEISYNKDGLAALGVVLGPTPQRVDFVLTQSVVSNPNLNNLIIPGAYYVATVGRTGTTTACDILLQEQVSAEINPTQRLTVFSQNQWVDVPESNTWFEVYTDAVRVTNGTAFDAGVLITSPKDTTNDITGVSTPYINGEYSLLDTSSTATNYVIVQKGLQYSDLVTHPVTGNEVDSRVQDYPTISVVNAATLSELIETGSNTVVLASVVDTNPVHPAEDTITGTTKFPGLVTANTFTIIQPVSDVLTNNLMGSILTPNTGTPQNQYRIVRVDKYTDAYGDANGDGVVDANDLVFVMNSLDGYSTSLTNTIKYSAATQLAAIEAGTVTMPELLRSDVNGDGIVRYVDDGALINQNIALHTAFPVGASFSRVVLTVEALTNPLTTTVNMLTDDPNFNVPANFPAGISYSIAFNPLWSAENLLITDLRRFVPKTFTTESSTTLDGGFNSFYVPGDLILDGDVVGSDGSTYNFDFEVNTIIMNLSEGQTISDVPLFDTYIKGKMKFYDGTLVTSSALASNQVKVSVSIQSITKDAPGFDQPSIDENNPINESLSALYVPSSGLLRIRTNNLRAVSSRPELSTKLVITVYLKKAGFENADSTITLPATSPSVPILQTGSIALNVATLTLTPAQIVGSSVGTLGSTDGVAFVAAVAGKTLIPTMILADFTYAGAAYTGGGSTMGWMYSGGNQTPIPSADGLITGSANGQALITSLEGVGTPKGQAIALSTLAAYTNPGSAAGTLTVTMYYYVV